MKFIKDSLRELRHVVWPTREESIKYFVSVVVILFLFGLYLFFFNFIFSEGLIKTKEFVSPTKEEIIDPSSIKVIPSTGEISTGSNVENSTGKISTGNTLN